MRAVVETMERGQVVKSLAGHDKGLFLAVLEVQGRFLILCDGRRRTLEKPKKKKLIHTAATKLVLTEEQLGADKRIREALKPYNA